MSTKETDKPPIDFKLSNKIMYQITKIIPKCFFQLKPYKTSFSYSANKFGISNRNRANIYLENKNTHF